MLYAPVVGMLLVWAVVGSVITARSRAKRDNRSNQPGRRSRRARHLFVLQASGRQPLREPGRLIASAVVERNDVGAGSVRAAERRMCWVVADQRPTVSAKGRRRLRHDFRSPVTRHLADFTRTGDACALVRSGAIVDRGDLTIQLAGAAEA